MPIPDWLIERVAQRPESIEDPIDRAAAEAALRMISALNLWYGDLALYICNFGLGAATVVHVVPTVEESGPREPKTLMAARAAATELARSGPPADDSELARTLLGLADLEAPDPLQLDAIGIDAAFERLRQHLSTSQMRAPFAEARALLDVFAASGHRWFTPVGAARGQIESTVLYARASDGRRVALIDYTGDGP